MRNFRIKKDNATMAMSCDMKVQFWVLDPKKEPVMALELLQQNVQFSFTVDIRADGHMEFKIIDKKEGKPTVTTSKLGQPPPDPTPVNSTDPEDNEPRKNFGLNMHKIHAFLIKFKPSLLNNLNE